MESIKDKVAIIGMGCTTFGELWDKGDEDLMVEATAEAIKDAGIELKDIQAAWVGNAMSGEVGTYLSVPLRLKYIPVTRVENRCCTGSDAIRNAAYAIASGACDVALVVGCEKQKDTGFSGTAMGSGELHPVMSHGHTAANTFALRATRYAAQYRIPIDQLRLALAKIAVKNHRNGTKSPLAHFRNAVTIEQVLNSPIVCWPLGLLDCCPVTDGAAAAVLCRADMAKSFRHDYVLIKALGLAAGPGEHYGSNRYDLVHWEEAVQASRHAYGEAGISDPIGNLDLVELHDCFTIAELIMYEDLSLCPRGQAVKCVEEGVFEAEGKLPVNVDGGLKAYGHPTAATGVRMAYECYKQLQGKAGARQLKNPRIGLTENQGGGYGSWVAAVNVYGSRD